MLFRSRRGQSSNLGGGGTAARGRGDAATAVSQIDVRRGVRGGAAPRGGGSSAAERQIDGGGGRGSGAGDAATANFGSLTASPLLLRDFLR